jgi:hypothetical protein
MEKVEKGPENNLSRNVFKAKAAKHERKRKHEK